MSRKYARKKDVNHTEIVKYLEVRGVWVFDAAAVGGITDCIIHKRGQETAFLEIKRSGSGAKYTRSQLIFMAGTPAPVCIATDADTAYNFALDPKRFGLTQRQKDSIYSMLYKYPDRKFFTPAEIENCLK